MKKSKFLFVLPMVTIATVAPLTYTLSSCSKSFNEHTNEVYDSALKIFTEQICSVPHPSYKLDAIRNIIKGLVTNTGYKVYQDFYGNIWWDIPATAGCTDWKPLVLQAHMDMVWTVKDLTITDTHPEPVVEESNGKQIMHTKDNETSLGADNGAGVAAILAITLNKNIQHGKLRCIITADEEPGMVGASCIGVMDAQGKEVINVVDHNEGWDYLLNIDGEAEDEIYVSCAGGYSHKYTIDDFNTTEVSPALGVYGWKLTVDGCRGGHSGVAIKNNLVNAIKIGVEVMSYIQNYLFAESVGDVKLISINSFENAANVVPKKTEIAFACGLSYDPFIVNEFQKYISSVLDIYKHIYSSEPNLNFSIEPWNDANNTKCLSPSDTNSIFNFISNAVYGLVSWDTDGRPIASSNICPVMLDINSPDTEHQFEAFIYSRSEDKTLLDAFATLATANINTLKKTLSSDPLQPEVYDIKIAEYDSYLYKENDVIRELAKKGIKKFGIESKEARVHGGIECSWWYKYNPDISQTGIGPNIDDVHTIRETLHLDSFKRYVSTILDVISGMKNI